jgi:hypothetical protein
MYSLQLILEILTVLAAMFKYRYEQYKSIESKRRLLTEYDKQDGVGATLESLSSLFRIPEFQVYSFSETER